MTIFNVLSLIGGLAMFLFGMNVMGNGLEKVSGGKLESALEKMTNNRIKGVLLGLGVTAIIQSSSAVTVMAVGFVNSGIMQLYQVVGIIMGANIGTTVTAWLLSLTGISSSNLFISFLKPSSFSPILALIGIILLMFCQKSEKKRDIGTIMLGFAVLMFGMETMSTAVAPLKDVPSFTHILTMFSNPILGVLAGAILTAIIQSSSASVGILQALAVTGSISWATAFPIILGQNIGTCITAIISSIGANKNAKRTAVIHLSFNVIGVVLGMVVFYGANAIFKFAFMKTSVSAADIAVIHSIFNIATTVVLFPFGKQIEKLSKIIIKDSSVKESPELVEERFLMSPAYAVEKCQEKANEMARLSAETIFVALEIIPAFDSVKEQLIRDSENELDKLEDELETYLIKISSMSLNIDDSRKLAKLQHAIGNFERMGDYALNILKTKKIMHEKDIRFSGDADDEIKTMGEAVREITQIAVNSFMKDDVEIAERVEPLEQVVNSLKKTVRAKHIERLENDQCDIELGVRFFDIVNSFERIADHCSNLAVCEIELSEGNYNTHKYMKEIKGENSEEYMELLQEYMQKYRLLR